MTVAKTLNFQNSLGVFQGGGCRGAAFVGAFKEATVRGVSFSELVGTSAGSLIAVLIGAGANPTQLEEIIKKLDFKKFLRPPVKLLNFKPNKILKRLPNIHPYLPVFNFLGKYDSSYISEFIEKELRVLLKKDGPIKFSDLIIPTSVVATDLNTKRIKIWSSSSTPDDDVSFAVRASCTIPVFFQPIHLRYVDGGILSNLPSFIYSNRQGTALYDKILAFSLVSAPVEIAELTVKSYFTKLIDTAIEGSSALQLGLQKNVHVISINTGDISATDFDKIDEESVKTLMEEGRTATQDFFENELTNIKNKMDRSDICFDNFQTNNIITKTNDRKVQEILICEDDTSWVYELFPTLIKWKTQGAHIQIKLKKNNDDPIHGPYRSRFIKSLGITLEEVDNLPFKGYIINGNNADNASALIFNQSKAKIRNYDSKYYHGEEDYIVIKLLRELFEVTTELPSNFIPTIEAVPTDEIIKLLKNVSQYSIENIKIYSTTAQISNLTFITKFVRGFKFRQIDNLINLYNEARIDLFLPAKLNLLENKSTLITPPVLEKHGNEFVVIEGNTRLTHCYKNGIENVNVIIVEGVREPLPSSGRFTAQELLISDLEKIGDDRYDDFDYSKFRKIEKAVRNPNTSLL